MVTEYHSQLSNHSRLVRVAKSYESVFQTRVEIEMVDPDNTRIILTVQGSRHPKICTARFDVQLNEMTEFFVLCTACLFDIDSVRFRNPSIKGV